MAVIFPNLPNHGDGDWDIPLDALLSALVVQGNTHELSLAALGNQGQGFLNLNQNADGTWTMSITGMPTGTFSTYDGGTYY